MTIKRTPAADREFKRGSVEGYDQTENQILTGKRNNSVLLLKIYSATGKPGSNDAVGKCRGLMNPILRAITLVFLAAVLTVRAQPQPKPKEQSAKGPSAEKWLEDLRAANRGKWREKTLLSPPLILISAQAKDGLHDHLKKGSDCQMAAANLADAALFQDALKGNFQQMTKGAALAVKELIEALSPASTLKKLLIEAAKKGAEWLIKYIQALLAKEKAEVHVTETSRSGCQMVIVTIWNKPNSSYEVIIYGDCKCTTQKTGLYQRPEVKMSTFEIRVKGQVYIGLNETKDDLSFALGDPTVSVVANCDNCPTAGKATSTDPKPPVEKPPGPNPPTPEPPTPAPTDNCKVPPPCPECKAHYDKIVAACGRIKEIDDELIQRIAPQLKAREQEVKTATGTVLKRLEREIAELNADKQKLSAEKAGLQTQIQTDTANLKGCERTRCGKTATGNQSSALDACLVGAWRSTSVSSVFQNWDHGGEGVILMIGGDGQTEIDYSNAQPNIRQEKRTWGGTAAGRIAAGNGILTLTSVGRNGSTMTVVMPNKTVTFPMSDGLGWLLQMHAGPQTKAVYVYTCDATTLRLEGRVLFTSTFKRVGTTPR